MKKAILYARCSTEEQGDKRFSLDYQLSQMRSHPMLDSMEVVGTYTDVISGTTFERRSLSKIYALCKAISGYCDFLFIEQWDRFGRNTENHFATVREFKELGVEVNALYQMVDYDNAMWPQFLGMYATASHAESIKISQRTRKGLAEGLRQGYYTASAPVGYIRRDSQDRTRSGSVRRMLCPDPDKAPIILKMFEMYEAGYERSDLRAKYQQRLGVTKSSFYRIFSNVVYAGYIDCPAYNYLPAQRVEARHEPIVPLSLYERVQKKIAASAHHNSGRTWTISQPNLDYFFLKGILHCDNTDRTMTGYYCTNKIGNKYPYYRTVGKVKKPQNLPARYCHTLVGDALGSLQHDADRIKEVVSHEVNNMTTLIKSQIININAKIRKAEKRLTSIEDKYLDGEMKQGQYDKMNKKYTEIVYDLATEKESLVSKLEFLSQTDWDKLEHLTYLSTTYSQSDGYDKNKLLKAIFPEGFSIDRDRGIVRTPQLNQLLYINDSLPTDYKYLEIKTGQENDLVPLRVQNKTKLEHLFHHYSLLKNAI